MPRKPAIFMLEPLSEEDKTLRQTLGKIDLELLGERLRRARQEQNITQRAVCQGLFTSAYLSSIELGKTRPTLHTLQQIAQRVNKPVAYFLRASQSGSAGLFLKGQPEQLRVLYSRQILLQVRVALSKKDLPEAASLLQQISPILSRLPVAEQLNFHLTQAALFNRQNDPDTALNKLEICVSLVETPDLNPGPDTLASMDLEYGLAYLNQSKVILALNSFQVGLGRAGLSDLYMVRRLKLYAVRCFVALGQSTEAAALLSSLSGNGLDQKSQLLEIVKASNFQTGSVNFQEEAFLLGRTEQIWAQHSDTARLASCHLEFARILYHTGQYELALAAAINAHKSILKSDPTGLRKVEVLVLLALVTNHLNLDLKEKNKAQEWLEEAATSLKIWQDQGLDTDLEHNLIAVAEYYQAAAEISVRLGQFDKAVSLYHQALNLVGNQKICGGDVAMADTSLHLQREIYFELCQVLRQLGRYEEALRYIEKAYQI